MKVGFVTTMHVSKKYRPHGEKYINDYILSLFSYAQFPFKIYIIDNGSDNKWNSVYIKNNCIDYTYIENQNINGITGAWNLGIYKSYKDGCDIICMTNDDMYALYFSYTL